MNSSTQLFQKTVWDYYAANGRSLPWRKTNDPYKIFVSEIMLQQTQVNRVISKYEEFLLKFPNVQSLASSNLADVLTVWSGLGYNRRAKFLWQAANTILTDYEGRIPGSANELVRLPGVGINTAGAVIAYAFNKPVVFIETNIRTVYIYHFFTDQNNVTDKSILEILEQTLPNDNVREWYWALMDYGTHLKLNTTNNLASQSKHYVKQSKFEGSKRQIRGIIIKQLVVGPQPYDLLGRQVNDKRYDDVVRDLLEEGLIVRQDGLIRLH